MVQAWGLAFDLRVLEVELTSPPAAYDDILHFSKYSMLQFLGITVMLPSY